MRSRAQRLRTTLALTAALGLALTASACGRFGGAQPEQTSGSLNVWVVAQDGQLTQSFEAASKGFADSSGIQVKVTGYQNDQFKQNIANATGTDAMPDVFINWSGIGLIGNIYESGTLQDMDSAYTKYSWDPRFNKAAVSTATIDGKKYGVPYVINEMAVVYKKSTMQKAGITEMPTTYDGLLALNDKLLSKGVTPFSFAGKQPWNLMRLTDSLLETKCGSQTFDDLRNLKADWTTTPCAEQGFAELDRWISKGYLTKNFMALDPNANQMYTPIVDGKAAMTIDGNWSGPSLKALKQNPDDYSFFVFPTDTQRLSYFTSSWWVNGKGKNVDNASRYVDYMTQQNTVSQNTTMLQGAISGTLGVAPPATATTYDKAWFPLSEKYTGVYLPSDQAFVPDVAQSYLRNQDKLALGQQSPAKTAAAIQSDAKVYLDQKK